MNKKNVVLLGASGLVGSNVLTELLAHDQVGQVTVLVRTPLQLNHPKLRQVRTDFTNVSALDSLGAVDALFCCIGTTRKKTPNLTEYKAIDYGINMAVATHAKAHGCKEIHLVSSVGANPKSSNFYLKIKGEVEEGIQALGIERCFIYRPSMLIGARNESRPAEKLGQLLTPLFDVFTFGGKYHSIKAGVLASAMCTFPQHPGISILHYREIIALI
jgi:uncharacterized protein YbjT (DUF2867 family)